MTYDNGAWLTPSDQRLSFQVKGCFNARIALLTDKYNKDRGYEVLLGGFDNTGSGIFSGAEVSDLYSVQYLNNGKWRKYNIVII